VAPWRYQRGCRSLLDNLQAPTASSAVAESGAMPKDAGVQEENDAFVPLEVHWTLLPPCRAAPRSVE